MGPLATVARCGFMLIFARASHAFPVFYRTDIATIKPGSRFGSMSISQFSSNVGDSCKISHNIPRKGFVPGRTYAFDITTTHSLGMIWNINGAQANTGYTKVQSKRVVWKATDRATVTVHAVCGGYIHGKIYTAAPIIVTKATPTTTLTMTSTTTPIDSDSCPVYGCKVYFDGCNTCQCTTNGALRKCSTKNTCAGKGKAKKCRKFYVGMQTTGPPVDVTNAKISCRQKGNSQPRPGALTHAGTTVDCALLAKRLNAVSALCGNKGGGGFVCEDTANKTSVEKFLHFEGTAGDCKASSKYLTKAVTKFNVGSSGVKKVKFMCSSTESVNDQRQLQAVRFRRISSCGEDANTVNAMVALFVDKLKRCRK